MGRRVSVAELVGRQDELAALDAGVGKSRLIQAFTSRAAAGLRSRIQAAALAQRRAADES